MPAIAIRLALPIAHAHAAMAAAAAIRVGYLDLCFLAWSPLCIFPAAAVHRRTRRVHHRQLQYLNVRFKEKLHRMMSRDFHLMRRACSSILTLRRLILMM